MASDELFKHTGVIGALTLLSRLLGLLRDAVCAAYFGAGMVWDAFSFAFRVPNLFRRLFGEGALSAAFIPVFTGYLEGRDREAAWRLAGAVAVAICLVLAALVLLGESFVLLLPRIAGLSERWRLTFALTAVMLPYAVFVCLTALAGAVLNSLRHFAAPALAPLVLNVCWIAAVVIFAPLVSDELAGRAFVVAAGVLMAGLFQLLIQLWALTKKGFRWRLSLNLRHPGLARTASAMLPIAAGLAAFQVNVLIDGVMAISLAAPEGTETFGLFGARIPYPMQVGANSVLYFGNRLMQFPLGVFGIALATAIFPALSSQAARKNWPGFSQSLMQGLGAVILIGVPAGVGLMMLREPAVDLIFRRGAFTQAMSVRTQAVILAYCAGMWAYCAVHVLTRAFYSIQDTLTPVKIAAAMVALNLALNLTLVWFVAEAGLAAATAISAACQAALLYALLVRRLELKASRALLLSLLKTLTATVLMAAACALCLRLMPAAPARDLVAVKLLRLLVPMAVSAAVFLGAAAALRTRELSLIVTQLLHRRRQ